MKNVTTFLTAFLLLTAGSAQASYLNFQGQNAGIFPGANPSDTSAMMNSVPRPAPTPQSSNTATSQIIMQALQSQISSHIYSDIFGTNALPTGKEFLPDGSTVEWAPDTNNPGNVLITFTSATGVVTTASIIN